MVFKESTAQWCLAQMRSEQGAIVMSTVNYAEALIKIGDIKPTEADYLREEISLLPIEWIAPTSIQAEIAANARLKFPLNLGDCFAYALAKLRDDTLLTCDRDFRNTDISVLLPPRH